MRNLVSSVLMCCAALPLAAWEPLAQNELAAIMGTEPCYAIALAGLPPPPTRAEAQKAAGFRYGMQRLAMKRVLLYRASVAKGDRHRITQENNRATAAMARHLGAPDTFCVYLERLASGELSRREEYAAEQALRMLVQDAYGIDMLQIRLITEQVSAPPAQHVLFMLQLPISSMFDVVLPQPPDKNQVLSDIQTMTTVLRMANEALRQVADAASATEAAARLADLLPLWNTTLQVRAHYSNGEKTFTPAETMAVQLLNHTTAQLMQTRRHLAEKDWFGSQRLRLLDTLLR